MADHSSIDGETPRRRRRGSPPRLYVIARQSPVPWLRVRRLGEADRPALVAHLQGLAAQERRPRPRGGLEEASIAECCAAVDFRTVIAFGAIAGNAVIALACGVPGPRELDVAATEDADYLERDLGTMLVQQVLGAQPAAELPPRRTDDAGTILLQLMRGLGARALRRAEPDAPEAAIA